MATSAARLQPSSSMPPPAGRLRWKPRLRGELPSALSPREEEVVRMVAEGYCSKEIATALGLSTQTVDTHRHNIHIKLGVTSQVFMVHYALAKGLVANKFQGEEFYGS